jgi:hypothetical protein
MRRVVIASSVERTGIISNTNKKVVGEAAILKWINSCGPSGFRMIYHPIGVPGSKDVMIYGGQPRSPGLYIADQLAGEKWQKSGKTVLKKVKDYLDQGGQFSIILQDSFAKANRMGVTWEDTDLIFIK